jgi:hypothetical protein
MAGASRAEGTDQVPQPDQARGDLRTSAGPIAARRPWLRMQTGAWNARWLMVRQAGNADGIRRGPSAGQRPVPAAAVSQTPTSAPLHDIAGTPAATASSSLAQR